MKCSYPVKKFKLIKGTRFWYEHACGQCMPCRITKRQQWALRILLESFLHKSNIFVTLTYSPQYLPKDKSVNKAELQKFIKRLRKNTKTKFRYYACGEYGEQSQRPHYHLVIFGLSLDHEEAIGKAWDMGFIQVDELNSARASYVARYTTKKLTSDHAFEDGRKPEFGLMSRKPGLAREFNENIMRTLEAHDIEFLDTEGNIDPNKIPNHIRFQQQIWPLDNYLKNLIRSSLALEEGSEFQKYLISHRLSYAALVLGDPDGDEARKKSAAKAKRIFNKRGTL